MVFRGRTSREARIKRFIRRHFGVRVRSLAPYEEALRHSSSVACQRDGLPSNERLEFLGDSVLDMIVVDMLFGKFPQGDEGAMTRMKSRLVSRESLNFLGQEIGVEHLLDAQTGKGAIHASLRGNAMEALVGAVYLDKGFTKTQKGVLKLLGRFDLDERIQARQGDAGAHREPAPHEDEDVPVDGVDVLLVEDGERGECGGARRRRGRRRSPVAGGGGGAYVESLDERIYITST